MSLTKEKKVEIFKEFGGKAENTGSTEAQIPSASITLQSISKKLKKIFHLPVH
jgi:small subunit ribosomal protein S15